MIQAYQYTFGRTAVLEDVESTLLLAIFATQSIHGEVQTLMDVAHSFDREGRQMVIDASTEVGRDLNRVFSGFLHREFGHDGIAIKRVTGWALEPAVTH